MKLKSSLKARFKHLWPTRAHPTSYNCRFPFDGSAEVHIAVVGSERHGLKGQGKTRPDRYFPKFEYGAIKAGATVGFYQTPSLLVRSLHVHDDRPLAVIFLYNEERIEDYPSESTMHLIEQRPRTIVYNSPAIARKIAEKPVTNGILIDAGIDVPRMLDDADIPIFSNTNTGSMQPTSVVAQGSAVDPARYNTELIDTRIKVDGSVYYTVIRAMCIAGKVLDVYVFCSSVEDGTPNVHGVDSPLDPKLLKTMHRQHVQPRMDEIHSLCSKLGSALGPAFYCHDILLSQDGRLPVCEVGFKFDAPAMLDHLWPVSSGLDFMRKAFLYEHAEEGARVVAENTNDQRV